MGQIQEALKQKDRAVASYKKAYELDQTQRELIVKIIQLLMELPVDPQRARSVVIQGWAIAEKFRYRIYFLL